MPRSGSASAALISNINMLADHKHHASGALWSTRWSTGAGQRSEVHELRLSHRAPQCMSWRRPPTRRSRHAAGSPSCVGYQEPWPSAPPQGPGCAGVVARGYCGLLISPIEVLAGAGTPPIWPPFASERPLIGRSSLNSWGNFVWVQGPRRSAPSPLTEALCSPCPVRGARGLDLGPWPFVLDR